MRFVQSPTAQQTMSALRGLRLWGWRLLDCISASLRTSAPRCVRIALLSETLSLFFVHIVVNTLPFLQYSLLPLARTQCCLIPLQQHRASSCTPDDTMARARWQPAA